MSAEIDTFFKRTETRRGPYDFITYGARDRQGYDFELSKDMTNKEPPCVWLGLYAYKMHLDQSMVAELIPLLEHFVETGRLP